MRDTIEIGLVTIDRSVAREVTIADAEFIRNQGLVSEGVGDLMAGVIGMMSEEMLSRETWGCYFVYDLASRQVVGTCGFRARPDASGVVEIAYYTFPPFEGRGYGAAMARALVSLAQASDEAQTIIAHTLPEPNASTRILERTGFTLKGDFIDPEDGRVWRWAK